EAQFPVVSAFVANEKPVFHMAPAFGPGRIVGMVGHDELVQLTAPGHKSFIDIQVDLGQGGEFLLAFVSALLGSAFGCFFDCFCGLIKCYFYGLVAGSHRLSPKAAGAVDRRPARQRVITLLPRGRTRKSHVVGGEPGCPVPVSSYWLCVDDCK